MVTKVYTNTPELPICHIISSNLLEGLFPQVCKSAKAVHVPKNKQVFSAANSRPMSILPMISKLMEKVIRQQMLCYFSLKAHDSTCTALVEMTDKWVSYTYKKMIFGTVL